MGSTLIMLTIINFIVNIFLKFHRQSLPIKIFEALISGIIISQFISARIAGFFSPFGEVFVNLFLMPIIPFTAFSIISGVGKLNLKATGNLLWKTGIVLISLWLIAFIGTIVMPLGYPNWSQSTFFSPAQLKIPEPLNLTSMFIPVNPFEAFATSQIPAIIFFSLTFGIALSLVEQKEKVTNLLDRCVDALLKITEFIAELTPYGTFAILLGTVSQIPKYQLPQIFVFVVINGIITIIMALFIVPLLIQALTPVKARDLLDAYKTPIMITVATGEILVVLPLIIDRTTKIIKDSFEQENEVLKSRNIRLHEDQMPNHKTVKAAVEVIFPLALAFPNMERLLTLISFIPFAGWLTGNEITASEMPEFFVAGIASTFVGSVTAIKYLLSLMGLSPDLINVYIAVEELATGRLGSLLATMSMIATTLIGCTYAFGRIRVRIINLQAMLGFIILLPLSALGARMGFNHIKSPNNPFQEAIESQNFIYASGEAIILNGSIKPLNKPGSWSSIQSKGKIRYCVPSDQAPYAYINKNGLLVGSDIEMALLFAEQMNLSSEFLVYSGSSHLQADSRMTRTSGLKVLSPDVQKIVDGKCDFNPVKQVVNPMKSSYIKYVLDSQTYDISFVINKKGGDVRKTWEKIASEDRQIRIGYRSYYKWDRRFFSEIVPNRQIQFKVYLSNQELLDALKLGEIDAATFDARTASVLTILNSSITTIIPKPAIKLPTAMSAPLESSSILVNHWADWMLSQKAIGALNRVNNYWTEGK